MKFRLLPPRSQLSWTPFAWLIYLSFFLVYGYIKNSPRDWIVDGAALIAFLALYFRAFWVSGAALLRVVFGIVAIGLLVSPRNPGANCFFIYGAAFLGELSPPSRAFRWLVAIVAIVGVHTWFWDLPPQFWVPALVFSLLVGGSNIHFGEMRRKDQALIKAHELAEQLARTAERERIARDLHDLLGHTLSVIVLKSELASKLADRDPARAAAQIREVEQISRNALAEVRRAIQGFRSERLTGELATSRKALEAAGVTLEAQIERIELDADIEGALALALREAITNVVRHSRATRCQVSLRRNGESIRLTITDNGVGGPLVEGSGLAGMRARVSEIGGSIESDGTSGTQVTLVVPAPARGAAQASPEPGRRAMVTP